MDEGKRRIQTSPHQKFSGNNCIKKILTGHSGLSGFVLVFFKCVNYDMVSINLKCCQKFSVYVYV